MNKEDKQKAQDRIDTILKEAKELQKIVDAPEFKGRCGWTHTSNTGQDRKCQELYARSTYLAVDGTWETSNNHSRYQAPTPVTR